MFEIRIFESAVSGLDEEAYSGNEQVLLRKKTISKKRLLHWWNELLKEYEGYAYSVFEGTRILVGGIYDPGDIDFIEESLRQ